MVWLLSEYQGVEGVFIWHYLQFPVWFVLCGVVIVRISGSRGCFHMALPSVSCVVRVVWCSYCQNVRQFWTSNNGVLIWHYLQFPVWLVLCGVVIVRKSESQAIASVSIVSEEVSLFATLYR